MIVAGTDADPDRRARPLRVLQVVDGLLPGGAQTLVYAYARLGAAWNVTTSIAAIAPTADADLAARLRSAAEDVTLVEHDSMWDPRLLATLVATMRRRKVDLVHTHLAGADIAGGAAARLLRVPVVSTLHAVAEHRDHYTRRRRLLADAATRRLSDALIAVSSAARDSHVRRLGIRADAVEVIPNPPVAPILLSPGFDREAKRRELGVDGAVVTMVARLDRQKDHDTLLSGMRAACAADESVVLLVVGDGPRRAEIERLVAAHGLEGRVRLLGSRPDAVEIMAASDIACQLTLDLEGIPVALLDGLALGLPTIATAARGADEVLEDGRSGLLVPQRDAEAFGRALVALLRDGDLRALLAAGGRRRVASAFGIERWMERTRAVYDRALRARTARR